MSPIKNLTDQITPRFPRLGKLRKGGERPENGKAPGQDLDHFRFVSENPAIVQAFTDAYGETPRTIQVYIPYPTPDEAFPTWAEVWGATGLLHRCDGETMTVWQENGKYITGEKPCPGGHKDNDYLRDAVGRLDLIIPELIEAGHVGYVTLETHGKHDIRAILQTLHAVYEARSSNELGLRGVLFNLRRVQESISTPGFGNQAGKRSRVNKWLVKLEPAADWMRLQLEMARSAQMLPAGDETPQLESGEDGIIEGQVVEPQAPAPNLNGMTELSAAAAMTTPKGAILGELDLDHLKVVVEKGKDNVKKAAERLIAKPTQAELDAYSALFQRAKKNGLEPVAIAPNAPAVVLYQTYSALKGLIDEAEAEIPEVFRG